MPRYVAFLRGVSPLNAKMPELKRCFDAAGFSNVRTLLASGNVVFDARSSPEASVERRAEAQMRETLGRVFVTFVRRVDFLRQLLESDPYAGAALPAQAKRVVSFLRRPATPPPQLPLRLGQAQIVAAIGRETYAAYVATENGPEFMRLIERTFGSEITTRTWETVTKCVAA